MENHTPTDEDIRKVMDALSPEAREALAGLERSLGLPEHTLDGMGFAFAKILHEWREETISPLVQKIDELTGVREQLEIKKQALANAEEGWAESEEKYASLSSRVYDGWPTGTTVFDALDRMTEERDTLRLMLTNVRPPEEKR